INAMMWQRDIENFDFAYNCVNWLTEQGKRHEVLFLEEGEIQKTFEIPLKEPPPPPIPPLKAIVAAVDKGIGELESEPRLRLTDKSLAALLDADVPDPVLRRLHPLRREALEREQFVERLGELLDGNEQERFQDLIVKHAESNTIFNSAIV